MTRVDNRPHPCDCGECAGREEMHSFVICFLLFFIALLVIGLVILSAAYTHTKKQQTARPPLMEAHTTSYQPPVRFLSLDRQIRMYKRKLEIEDRTIVFVQTDDTDVFRAHWDYAAYTQRHGDVCLVRIRPRDADDRRVIAHEVCHCALDFEYLTDHGWHEKVENPRARENDAEGCAQALIR